MFVLRFTILVPQATRRSRRGFNAVVADVDHTVALSENETALATNSLLELALGDINSPSDNTNSLEGLVYRDPLESGAGEFFHWYLILYSLICTQYHSAHTK